MSVEYDNYIREHRENLKRGLEWMQQNLSGPFINGEKLTEALLNAEQHDQSKYDKEEYDPYDAYFYGPEKTPEVKSAFDYAWLRHIHNNPHHWQYWVLLEDDPEVRSFGKVLDMPLEYIYEMIADWWSFSWRANNLMEIFDWYASHQDNIRLAMKTRMIVNELIGQIYKVLKMQMILNGKGDEVKTYIFIDNDPIAHSGIKGQRWGVRRFQNEDGSLTEEGKKRYRKTVFISGSSKTQSEDSPYYRAELPKNITNELDMHMKNNDKILVGDAPGIDRQVQDYLNSKNYDRVEVYGPGEKVRYSANEKWKTNPIDDPDHEVGSKEWLAKKDIAMANAADEGLAIILDEGSKATRKNIERLIKDDKNVKVFQLDQNGTELDRWLLQKELKDVIAHSDVSEDDKHEYGIPELKKYPMPDKDHVKSAIRFFNYVDVKHEKELAEAILERMKEYGMSFDDFGVGDENRFKKYIPKDTEANNG